MRRFHDAALPHLDAVWARATDALRAAGLSGLSETNTQYRALSGARNERGARRGDKGAGLSGSALLLAELWLAIIQPL
jgi:hypothetical protein